MSLEEVMSKVRESNEITKAGVLEVFRLAKLLRERFGETGRDALLVGLRRDIVQQDLSGPAAIIYVRATRILYESAKPLRR